MLGLINRHDDPITHQGPFLHESLEIEQPPSIKYG